MFPLNNLARKELNNDLGNRTLMTSYIAIAQWCHRVIYILVKIGHGNGFLPDNTKPLPKTNVD